MIYEASIAFRLATELKPSTLAGAGDGIFALEGAPRGKFLGMDFPSYRKLCTDRDVPELPEEIQKFSWRHVEHVCFEAHDRRSTADLLNHSFDPNVHWHLGYYFAARDIRAGDELFVDYRYLFAPSWTDGMVDAETGRPVEGMDWRASLIHSASKLIDLIEGTAAAADDDLDRISRQCLELRNRQP